MKKFNYKAVVSVLFFAVLAGIMIVVFYGSGIEPLKLNSYDYVDWTAVYPRTDGVSAKRETKVEEVSGLEKYKAEVQNVKDVIGEMCNKRFMARSFFCNIYGEFSKFVGKTRVENSEKVVYKLKNGYLTYLTVKCDFSGYEKRMIDFSRYLEEKGINYLHVITADKSDETKGQFRYGVVSAEGENSDKYITNLRANNVNCMSAYEVLEESGMDYYSCFFRTDHHWKPTTGFYMTGKISERLNNDFNLGLDTSLVSPENFDLKIHEKMFLGSQGKKTTAGFTEIDDFEVLTPKYDTDFTIEMVNCNMNKRGSFTETLVDETQLVRNYYNVNNYTYYMWGDKPLIRIQNNLCQNGKRILVIKVSKANVITPYLACETQYLDIIDLRHYNGGLLSFIEQTKPDVVMTIYSTPAPGDADGRWELMR